MMKKRPSAISLPLPSRQSASHVALAGMLAVSVAAMVSVRANPGAVSTLRAYAGDVAAPLLSVLSSPAQAVEDARAWMAELSSIRAENARLKSQLAELSRWQASARALEQENKSLRALIAVAPSGATSYTAARIVSDSVSPYAHSALINVGAQDDVQRDQAVISGKGLIGRVIEAGQSSARVLLLTDINSRVPVMGELSRERSILAGNNSPVPSLAYVPAHTKLLVGERLLTSGDGGMFPPGIPVAVVSQVDGAKVAASPLADWRQSDYVSVVHFTF